MKLNPTLKVAITCVTGLALLFFFQNCGEGFKTIGPLSSTENSDFGVTQARSAEDQAQTLVQERPGAVVISDSDVKGAPAKGAILQRGPQGTASLKLAFQLPAKSVYYRTKLTGMDVAQTSSVMPIGSSQFDLRISTGMRSAQLTVQFFDSVGIELASWTSAPFSVGDVFLVAGQSNAATHGERETQAQNPLNKTWSYETKTWMPLADPMPLASHWKLPQFGGNSFYGGSPWPAFADSLAVRWGVPVGVISVAWGGSSVLEWLNGQSATYTDFNKFDEPLLNRLTKAALGLSGCQFKAVLWHQGESDTIYNTTRQQYKDRLVQLRNRFVQQTGCQQPWVIARASFVPTDAVEQMMVIRDAQSDIWREPGFLPGPDTDLFSSAAYRNDKIHFSVAGLKIHALLWADKAEALRGPSRGFTEEMHIPEVKQIMDLYRDILKRKDADIIADYNGIFYHSRLLQSGARTFTQVRQGIQQSDEAFIQENFLAFHKTVASMTEVSAIMSRMRSGDLKSRTELEIYIRNFYNKAMTATILGQRLLCGDLGDANKNTISSWYKKDLGRCPELDGINYWHSEWKKQNLGLNQWKVQAWDANPQVQSFKKCIGTVPTDASVTACYRAPQSLGQSFELCSPGAPWIYRAGSDTCYLK